jgi:dTDP-4-dehydrorhamnose reductase
MRHIVLGAGNLGKDLTEHLSALNYGPDAAIPWCYPTDGIMPVLVNKPEVIWCCVGAGSVEGAKNNMPLYIDLHVRLAAELLQFTPPGVHLIFFSSDYAANELSPSDPEQSTLAPKSLYACSKLWLEHLVKTTDRSRAVVIRIGSLYGNHRPDKTFPGKLRKNCSNLSSIDLPINRVTPTPTWWLAEILASNWRALFSRNRVPVHHLAPTGNVTTLGWARLFMDEKFSIKPSGFDAERPAMSLLGCSIPGIARPAWSTLWHDDRNDLRQRGEKRQCDSKCLTY